jgi:hypothetical protein
LTRANGYELALMRISEYTYPSDAIPVPVSARRTACYVSLFRTSDATPPRSRAFEIHVHAPCFPDVDNDAKNHRLVRHARSTLLRSFTARFAALFTALAVSAQSYA